MKLTPFQTVGPFLHLGMPESRGQMAAVAQTRPIVIHGQLIDGGGAPIPDGVIEFWAEGFSAIGRAWTNADGRYRLETSIPLAREESDGSMSAPHFAVRVMARGVLTEYLTRVYFDGEAANDQDSILALVPVDRRSTLIAPAVAPNDYRFDIIVQGERETVFFDV